MWKFPYVFTMFESILEKKIYANLPRKQSNIFGIMETYIGRPNYCLSKIGILLSQSTWSIPGGNQIIGAITKFKKSVGWTIDRFLLDISLVINEGILTFSYWKIGVSRYTFWNFWHLCNSYHQTVAIWILVSERQDKKWGFLEINLSKYSISKSRIEIDFYPDFVINRM